MEHPARALEFAEWEERVARGEGPGPMSVDEYAELPEVEYGREELLMGWRVSEASPIPKHQFAMVNLVTLLNMHLHEHRLGAIMAPASDIVLDEATRLVLVPDAAVILHDRMHVVGEKRLHAAPNLVIEALSPGTSRRDRVNKLEWYRKYGVDEYWIIDIKKKSIEIHDLTAAPDQPPMRFGEGETVVSRVLPDLVLKAEWVFGPLHERAIACVFLKDGRPTPGWPSTSRARRNRKPRYDTEPT